MANEMELMNMMRRAAASPPKAVLLPTGSEGDFDSMVVDFPFVVRYEGEWRLFYTGFDGERFRVGVAHSKDLRTWQRGGAVLCGGDDDRFDAHSVKAMWLLRHNDLDEPMAKMKRGLFWMAYTGFSELKTPTGAFGLVFSSDLEHWHRFEANPVLTAKEGNAWEKGGLTAPCLLERDKLFWLFYTGHNGAPAIGLALSTDFLVWSRDLENPLMRLEGGSVLGRPFVVRHQGQWWMLVSDGEGFRCALSEDLRRWRLLNEPPLKFQGVTDPANPYLFWQDGALWLFFSAQQNGRQGTFCVKSS